jgi:hypothetical protein
LEIGARYLGIMRAARELRQRRRKKSKRITPHRMKMTRCLPFKRIFQD